MLDEEGVRETAGVVFVGAIVNVAAAEVPAVAVTVTLTVPGVAIRLAGTAAVS
jgi:hypothetical protein